MISSRKRSTFSFSSVVVISCVVSAVTVFLQRSLFWSNQVTTASCSSPQDGSPLFSNNIATASSLGSQGNAGDYRQGALAEQLDIQEKFMKVVWETQNPPNCSTARILLKPTLAREKDGFAVELIFIIHYLHIAVATNRALVINPSYQSAYAPRDCSNWNETGGKKPGKWACLFKFPSPCTQGENIGGMHPLQPDIDGIVHSGSTVYFDLRFYGPNRIVEMPNRFERGQVDIIPSFQRLLGRYWVKSQLAHFLWQRMQPELEVRMQASLPKDLPTYYVGFHYRLTDNAADLLKDFGRNASVTRQFHRFMDIANNLQRDHPDLRHIYLATDNQDILSQVHLHPTWTFVVQPEVPRAALDAPRNWFAPLRRHAGGGIAADLEALRRADFLVGSMQSNVYRLAMQLNTAYHSGKYMWTMDRHFTVDVEYFENP